MSRDLKDLHPVVRAKTESLLKLCEANKIKIIITQTLRTADEQSAYYARGRRPLAVVNALYAKAGLAPISARENKSIVTKAATIANSFHGYGLAIDFAVMNPDGKTVLWDPNKDLDGDGVSEYREVAKLAESLGFEAGINWSSMPDAPHLQMRFGLTLADLKAGKRPA